MSELWYEVKDVARMMNRTPQRLYQLIECGAIPSRRIGGRKIVIPRQAFRAWQRKLAQEALASCGMGGDDAA